MLAEILEGVIPVSAETWDLGQLSQLAVEEADIRVPSRYSIYSNYIGYSRLSEVL